MITMPDFFDSPYFVPEVDNWHLKDDAPEELKKEFEEWIKQQKELEDEGIIV